MKVSANQVSMWASIFGIPPLAAWYFDHFPSVHAHMPSWAGQISLGVAVLFVCLALAANAIASKNLSGILSGHELKPDSGKDAPVKYVDHDFERDLTTTATYKSKFVVTLLNSVKKPIHLLAPHWTSQRGDVGLKTDFAAGYWLTRNGKRVDNIPEPTIEPNETFQIWVGLDEAPDLAALQRKKRSVQLGTLRVPIEVNGKASEPFERRF